MLRTRGSRFRLHILVGSGKPCYWPRADAANRLTEKARMPVKPQSPRPTSLRFGLRFGWRGWAAAALGSLGFLVAAALLVDAPVSRALTAWPDGERAFFRWLTEWGEAYWVLVPTLAIWLAMRLARLAPLNWSVRAAAGCIGGMAGLMFLGVGLPGLVSALLKRLLGRARPHLLDTHGTLHFEPWQPFNYALQSLPSGHATTSFAAAVVLVMLFGPRWGLAFAVAAMIALSRIVVGAHYFTDVAAGAALGTAGALLVSVMFAGRRWTLEIRDGRWRNRATGPVARWLRRAWRHDAAA